VLRRKRAMATLTLYLVARASGVVPARAARSRSDRGSRRQLASQLASSSCSGVAGEECVAGDLLDVADLVIEQDVGEFVGDVAVGARLPAAPAMG
jgi:hypothetical protein